MVGWAQHELSIKLQRWLGGPRGIVYHGIGNYTGAYIKLRRWLGGPMEIVYHGIGTIQEVNMKLQRWLGGLNNSLVLNYRDGWVGPWGLCIMG